MTERKIRRLMVGVLLAVCCVAPASAQQRAPRIWDIPFGTHVRDLPPQEFVDPSCGTNGGPAGLPLAGFIDFARCAVEPAGLREVWFIYDDTREYIGRALRNALIRSATTLLDQPVILSYLVDDDGLVQGLRVVTDPRAPADLRLAAHDVALAFKARYDVGDGECSDVPTVPGEAPIDGVFIKQRCLRDGDGRSVAIDERFFYRPGHQVVDPQALRTVTNEFESFARLEVLAAVRAAPLAVAEPAPAATPVVGTQDRRSMFLAGLANDCAGCELAGVDLRRRDLTDADLGGANLEGAVLHRANLRRANLSGTNLRQANLNRANLGFANLRGADLSGAMLYQAEGSRADLSGAILRNARMGRVNFTLARLDGADLDFADLGEARLNDASLVAATLNGTYMPLAVLFRADLHRVVADRAMMVEVGLRNANLSQASLVGTDLFGADLSGARMTEADFSGARLLSANLADTDQVGALFTGATMPDNSIHR